MRRRTGIAVLVMERRISNERLKGNLGPFNFLRVLSERRKSGVHTPTP